MTYRSVLPIVKPERGLVSPVDVRDADPPQTYEMLRPPKGAPNVMLILVDDMGFGAPSAFGGPCAMPNAERLATGGLKYTRFHTTALCSPTRASLLSGRNHHQVGMAAITEVATGYPGSNSLRPPSAAPLAEMLKLNGYSTAAFGKWHQTPVFETTQAGPFDHWPTGEGFEHFYGFIGGETDQWRPTLYEGVKPIDTPTTPGYHFSEDITTRTIDYIREQHTMTPDKPFYVYLSFGATHSPHHSPPEYIERYKGRFDKGWDAIREETLVRQRELGVVPDDCKLTERPESIPSWDSLDPDRHKLFSRMMEVYAGFAEHTDHQVGRVVDELESLGLIDDTIIIYILGDNGASGEGGLDGCLNEYSSYNLVKETIDEMLSHYDVIGSHDTFNHYPVGWAHAMNTPYQWTKQIASHWGGTRNGMVLHWPNGFKSKNEIRHQFAHVIDIAPTVLAAAGLPEPTSVNGVQQIPLPGFDLSYSFDDAKADEAHDTQYFEIFGNRGIYHKGWSACTIHNVPWDLGASGTAFFNDKWELYAPDDYSQANDLAAKQPEQLEKLKQLFLIEGGKYQVFPLDDRKALRLDPVAAGRPDLMAGRTEMVLYPGMKHLAESAVLNVKNRSHTVTAKIEVADGDSGVIIAQGGRFGGWSLYVSDGKPAYTYNWVFLKRYEMKADKPLSAGSHELRFEFDYDGGGAGKGGNGRLYVDGKEVASGRIDNTCGYTFALTDALDVGQDSGAVVAEDYGSPHGIFQGKIETVTINIDPKHHHDPEGMAKAVIARQ